MRLLLLTLGMLLGPVAVCHAAPETESVEIYGNGCEKVIPGESKSSTRVRASDKAVFLGVKKIDALSREKQILNDHDLNVMIYRLVDEFVEDLSVKTTKDENGKICVEVHGWLSSDNIEKVKQEFVQDDKPTNEATPEVVAKVAEEVSQEISLTPQNPENLALLHIAALEYFNGAKSKKFSQTLKNKFADNPYFYLTEDAEIADYVVEPKVLKAKVDAMDADYKRLQMVVSLKVSGLDDQPIDEYQNRFVLFDTDEDEQKIAARLIVKLLEQAGDGVLRKVERREQLKLEQNTLGRSLDTAVSATKEP